MVEQLAYVIITPYSIQKSRTGGIISRLLSRSGLELVSGRMFAPGKELVEKFSKSIVTETDERHRKVQELIREYVLKNFAPAADGQRARVLLVVLRGVNAVEKVRDVVGHIVHVNTAGETIRDTYGDYVSDGDRVTYFEPGVITAPNEEIAEENLKLWAEYSDTDGGILDDAIAYPQGSNVEKTLVLIKPDNFRFPNARPGAVIDTFSKTGLYIIGFKVHNMSVAEAEEFYRPVLDVLMDKLQGPTGKRSRLVIEQELGVELNDTIEKQIGELVGPVSGRDNWESIVQFMAGMRPSQCPPDKRSQPGTEKCVALIYQGVEAVRKIREVLGPTDPSKAPTGTIRKEFGQTIMINAAHASDAPENAQRETKIIRIQENNFKPLIESHYSKK
ncbi:MAG: nucleoside-diphosphate kinase [Chthoniobacterales bacterium]